MLLRDLAWRAQIFYQDPFSALGLKSLKIVNKVQFCEDEEECKKITDFAPKEKNFLPQVLAFFVQTHENFTGKINRGENWPAWLTDDSDEVSSDLGVEIDGKSWFFKNEAAARNLTRQAYKNYNMFYNPIFLHSRPILTLENPDKSTKVQETLGTIELEKTFLPENVAAQVKYFLVFYLSIISLIWA